MNKLYPLQWWLVTLTIAPLDYALKLLFHDRFAWDLVLLAIPFSVVYSLPTLGLIYVAFQSVQKLTLSPLLIKALLVMMAVIFTIITLRLIPGTIARDLGAVYISSLIFSAWIVKIQLHARQTA